MRRGRKKEDPGIKDKSWVVVVAGKPLEGRGYKSLLKVEEEEEVEVSRVICCEDHLPEK